MKYYDSMGFESENGIWVRRVDVSALEAALAEARELLRDARAELGPEVDVTGPAIDAHLAKYAGGSVAETTGKHP